VPLLHPCGIPYERSESGAKRQSGLIATTRKPCPHSSFSKVMTPYVPPFYPPASAHLIPRVPYDEGVGAVGTNLEAKRVGNAGIGGAIDVDGITVPFFKGRLERGFVYCMAQKSRQRDYVRSFPRSQCSVLPYCETCVLSLMFPAEGRRGVTKQIDKRATSIVYSMAKRTQRSTLIPHASRHETEHGVLPPDHPSIPHEFSESGVDLVLDLNERRVVPFHDSAPCHFAARPPGHGAQNKSRSKKVSLASNCLPDFLL